MSKRRDMQIGLKLEVDPQFADLAAAAERNRLARLHASWTIEYSPNFHAILCMHTTFALWYWGCATLGLDGIE